MSDADKRDPYSPPPSAEGEGPASADVVGAALASAARRAGIDPASGKTTGHVVWSAMGGWRGIAESILPSLAFLLIFTFTQQLLWALAISVGLAAVFTIVRFAMRQPASAAIGGLVAAGGAAALSLWTGRGEDNFLWGFATNAIYGSALLISALVGWSLIGLAAGFLMGEGTAWRQDARKRRAFFWLTIAWAGLFAARLAVQLPLWAAGDVTALGTTKLIMGLPLFAPMIAVTWLAVRAVYPARAEAAEPPAT